VVAGPAFRSKQATTRAFLAQTICVIAVDVH
jgi:hypothetical protein